MPYLIDGHNLIPKLGLKLSDPDDELELARILQEFARLRRQQIEVYFDGAPPASAGTRKLGTIKAHFISLGTSADSAMRARLNNMAKSAKNWTVVSSDREVQSAAKVNSAKVVSSEEFVKLLQETLNAVNKKNREEKSISAKEVEEWLKVFREEKK
ncbi:MAG: NYN domain-containing protein [Anaerolineales bacterium]|nr:NYN domain-containing protein [Anaerolineales bacterium]